MNPDLLWGRVLMGDTLGFHILFALLGVGIPLLVSLAELIGIVRRDGDFLQFARRWSFAMGVLFVVGAISGTVVAVEFFMLWPGFVAFAGPAIGLPMFLEVFAFFIEAIFLGVYVFTWDRWGNSSWRHWLASLPIILGSVASAFLITTVNAFMNEPSGIVTRIVGGVQKIVSVNPWQAMFGPAVLPETSHSIVAYYATTFFVAAAICALALWRRRGAAVAARVSVSSGADPVTMRYFSKGLLFCLIGAFVFALAVGFTGDNSARFLASHEPLKLATIEQLPATESYAPLRFFGVRIPDGLSELVGGTPRTVVKGLAAFDPSLWPPSFIHWLFDAMATSGFFLVVVPVLYFLGRRWRRSRVMFLLIIAAALAAIFSVEAGWIITEVGRQPFVVAGLLKTAAAFTPSAGVVVIALVFPVLYIILAVVALWILIRHYTRHAPL